MESHPYTKPRGVGPRNHPVNSRRGARSVEVRRRTRPMVLFGRLRPPEKWTREMHECKEKLCGLGALMNLHRLIDGDLRIVQALAASGRRRCRSVVGGGSERTGRRFNCVGVTVTFGARHG